MTKRHDSIGIKQTIRYEWMQKTSSLMLAGLKSNEIRKELHNYLTEKMMKAGKPASENTRTFAVNILMKIWVSPDGDLVLFRDRALDVLREDPASALAVHWGMISSAYPFWHNVSRHVGRLLTLQETITKKQVIQRVKSQYGDRQTVSRYLRYVIRSLVEWSVLEDAESNGCYQAGQRIPVDSLKCGLLLFESALHATPEGKMSVLEFSNFPSFFPFSLPSISANFIAANVSHLNVVQYGPNDAVISLP